MTKPSYTEPRSKAATAKLPMVDLSQWQNKWQNLSWQDRLGRKGLVTLLDRLQTGQVTLVEEIDGQIISTQTHPASENNTLPGAPIDSHVDLQIKDPNTYRQLAFGGSIGAAEAYILGQWDSTNLTKLLRLFARNIRLFNDLDDGLFNIKKPLVKLLHFMHRNSQKQARKNISAHYDLGNDLFELFLDPSMMYSAAVFPSPDTPLHTASLNKLKQICEKLQLKASDHLLEIGTGWGGLAIYAAQQYGCRVTTTTISKQQYDYAQQQIRNLGLENQITLLFEDYRNLKGQYDKLVSIEMIEAVGHEHLNAYFKQCSKRLKTDGQMLIQAICLPDQRYQRAKKNVDFIQRYIFPGGALPSMQAINNAVARDTDLSLTDLTDITQDYALTLNHWHRNFVANAERILTLGYDEQFLRLWRYYLCYCEAGFAERAILTYQITFTKPLARPHALEALN